MRGKNEFWRTFVRANGGKYWFCICGAGEVGGCIGGETSIRKDTVTIDYPMLQSKAELSSTSAKLWCMTAQNQIVIG